MRVDLTNVGRPGWSASWVRTIERFLCEGGMTAMQDEQPTMWVPQMGAVLSRWFTTYEEARTSLDLEGGYLLPYRKQFFVTTGAAIEELGLDPADPDWALIGWDWVRPADPEAWERLMEKRVVSFG
jgi:hypothetical protein